MAWRLEVLGRVRLVKAGHEAHLTATQRRLLTRLAAASPGAVPWTDIADALWSEPPSTAMAAIQNQVSRIRRASDTSVILTTEQGYRLNAEVDLDEVLSGPDRARRCLAEGQHDTALELAQSVIDAAVRAPFVELPDLPEALAARRALAAAASLVVPIGVNAALELGDHPWALVEAERLVQERPHDEAAAVLLARALAAVGRRGDALTTLASLRRRLRDDRGLTAGPEVERAEARILDHAPNVTRRPGASFVGRVDERRATIEASAADHLVVIRGEPGIGVTRFLQAVRSDLLRDGARAVMVTCPPHAGAPGETLLDLVDELGVVADRSRGVVGAFLEAVRTRAEKQRVVLIVDDVHHAGPTTVASLHQVARIPGVGVLVSTRFADDVADSGTVISLPPFTVDETAEFLEGMRRRPLSDEVVKAAYELSGGNPAVLEAIDLTVVETSPGPGSTRTGGEALEGLLDGVLEGLTPQERSVVELAAVAGDTSPAALLREVSGQGMYLGLPHGVLFDDDGTVRFRHGALAPVVYDRIPHARRVELHHALGDAAEGIGLPVAVVAAHLLESVELDVDRAFGAARRAGAAATVAGAHRDAAAWYARAGALPAAAGAGERDRLSVRIAQGDALRLAGDPAHTDLLLSAGEEALELDLPDVVADAAFALLQLGATTDVLEAPERVERLLEESLERAGVAGAARVMAAASLAWSLKGEASRSRSLFDAAEAAVVAAPVRRQVLPFAYMSLGMPDDLERREDLASELWQSSRDADDMVGLAEAHHLRFSCALQRGDGHAARKSLDGLRGLIDQVGDAGRRWQLLYMSAAIAHLDDDGESCERLAADALDVFGDVTPTRAVAAYYSQLLALRMTQGRVGELRPAILDLAAEQEGIPAWHAAAALAVASDAYADAGEVRAHVVAAIELAEPDVTWLAAHVVAARAVVGIGDVELAEVLLEVLRPWSGRGAWQGTCSLGPVDTALAVLFAAVGDVDAAREHATLAGAMCDRLGAPGFRAELQRVVAATDVKGDLLEGR